jgi:hypothetical protein
MHSFDVATLSDVSIRLFRGIDPVSHAICFPEGRMFGHDDFSHAGLAVTREALDLLFLEPARSRVGVDAQRPGRLPSSLHRQSARPRDRGRSVQGADPRSGAGDPRVLGWRWQGGLVWYTANLLDVFAVVFPALRPTRDRFERVEDRMAHFMNHFSRKPALTGPW